MPTKVDFVPPVFSVTDTVEKATALRELMQ